MISIPGSSLRLQRTRARRTLVVACLWLSVLVLAGGTDAAEPDQQVLRIEGMTFVASRDSVNEITLRAARARFLPDTEYAYLDTVDVSVARGDGKAQGDGKGQSDATGFEMTCDHGELDLRTSDFRAEGNVRGRTEDGRRFAADWVAYDDEAGVLYTDDPVLISEAGGSYRGGGFRYYVEDRRFRLMGGATVVQDVRLEPVKPPAAPSEEAGAEGADG